VKCYLRTRVVSKAVLYQYTEMTRAYLLGSINRPYYSPDKFFQHAGRREVPVLIVCVNYRLAALGFLHAETQGDIVPKNNALHDQIRALE
jgi:carboxylesterase type B